MIRNTNDGSPRRQLESMLTSWNVVPLLYAVTELRVADHLADGPKTAEQLAGATGTQARALVRVLRALATEGIFRENDAHQFELTPLADLLRTESAQSLRNQVLWRGLPMFWRPWAEVLHTLRTGETAFNHVYGMDMFPYIDEHPDDKVVFNNAMTHMTEGEGAAVAYAYDFKPYRSVIDIGGGHGSLITAVLSRYPNVRGAIFDLPDVVAGAQPRLETARLAQRCQLIGGSFFESVPPDYDAYVLKDIIHDWDDDQALTILRNCREAMHADAHLLLVERVILPGNDPHPAKWIDITMLLITGGMERTEQQYRDLLDAAGFTLDRITPTGFAHSVIRGVPK
jgi:hypothetical protein